MVRVILYGTAVVVILVWVSYFLIGFSHFNKNNAISIFSSVIAGMSALLTVAIAVIIFRIQSLENRRQNVEQSTLNYIYQIIQWTYPLWIPSVEEDIRSGTLANRYFSNRSRVDADTRHRYPQEESQKDRDAQQKRLEEALNERTKISQRIETMKNDFKSSVIFLILPILFSLLMLMVSDTLDYLLNLVMGSTVIFLSGAGIALLIQVALESMIET